MRCFCFSQNAFVGSSEANDRLALIGEDVSYSWFELEQRVNQCRLQIAGFTGDQPRPVVLHGQQEADFIAYILACLELGICYVPVDRSTPVARKQQIKQQLGAGLWVEVSSNQCYHFGEKLLFASDLLGQIAYIVFTSGSTGEPKGVVIPTRGLAHFSQWLKDFEKLQVLAQGPTQSGRRAVYGNMSLFGFDLSMLAWVPALANGQCLVLARRAPQNISEQLKLLAASGLSHWVSTPSLLYQCLLCAEFKPQQLVNLQAFYLCGEALAPTLVKQLKRRFPTARVFNFYGPTEATVAVSALEIDDDILRRYPELLPVGKFDPNIMKINSRAELELKGSSLMLNYLPQLQRDGDAHLSVFASGDEAEQSQGLLFIKQRLDSMVKLNGYRIDLAEINSTLSRFGQISGCHTIAVERQGRTVRLVSFVQLQNTEQGRFDHAQCLAYLAHRLPAYMLPSELLVVENMPVNSRHKLDVAQLHHIYAQLNQAHGELEP